MRAVVISDIHLGSRYLHRDLVQRFFQWLPPNVPLVLNGDILDQIHHPLSSEDASILDMIRDQSLRRQVVWVYGNHDDGFEMKEPGQIEFCRSYHLDQRLFISHGYDFDNVMTRYQIFVRTFGRMHRLRLWLGAEPVHVAQYAKKWGLLYRYLRRSVMASAVAYAKENGFEAVTCGHTHYAEDVTVEGIRYLNTGAWTELPAYVLVVNENDLELRPFE